MLALAPVWRKPLSYPSREERENPWAMLNWSAKAVALRFKKSSLARQFVYSLIILFGPLAPRVRAIPPDGVRQSALSIL